MVAAAEFHLGGICRRQLRGRGSREEAGECFARKRCLPTKMACEIFCRSGFLFRCIAVSYAMVLCAGLKIPTRTYVSSVCVYSKRTLSCRKTNSAVVCKVLFRLYKC